MKNILVAALILAGATTAFAGPKRSVASAQSATFSDTVVKINPNEEAISVLFEKTRGAYTLKRGAGNFAAALKKLEASLSSKKPVSVTADGAELNILEVK